MYNRVDAPNLNASPGYKTTPRLPFLLDESSFPQASGGSNFSFTYEPLPEPRSRNHGVP